MGKKFVHTKRAESSNILTIYPRSLFDIKHCKELGLNIWCYTGYTFEELIERSKIFPDIMKFLNTIDVLVDGKFVIAQKSLNLKFRGSKNQRIIDVPKSLKEEKVCLIPKYIKDKTYEKIAKKDHYMYV